MNLETTWITSDHHFGHTNVIKHMNRPFKNIEEMDEALIKNWNTVVGPFDPVFHLGDFAWHPARIPEYCKRLNGKIHLIRGNHDSRKSGNFCYHKDNKCFEWVKDYYELKAQKELFVLSHYPFESWSKAHYGSYHLHGHCHGSLKRNNTIPRLDVGVDVHAFTPINLKHIIDVLRERLFTGIDHHEGHK